MKKAFLKCRILFIKGMISSFRSFDRHANAHNLFVKKTSNVLTSTEINSKDSEAKRKLVETINKKIQDKILKMSLKVVDRVINNSKFLNLKKELYPEQYLNEPPAEHPYRK
jgi:hemerythrin